jgi:UDP-glucose 4-epimerase
VQAHLAALDYVNAGGPPVTLNAGYGHGYSVREVVDTVRQVSGRDFAVAQAPRRPGDIMAMIADTRRIRATLNWTPQFDNLQTIAAHALAWEELLLKERRQPAGATA